MEQQLSCLVRRPEHVLRALRSIRIRRTSVVHVTQKIATITYAALGVATWSAAASPHPQECPRRGTLEVVTDPAAWADQCFAAINGRAPQSGPIGEAASVTRDIDLDGVAERLEIRGVGNAIKQIYVFQVTQRGFAYLGELSAHPSFTVAPDRGGTPTITYTYRFGPDDLQTRRIQYRDGLYTELSAE